MIGGVGGGVGKGDTEQLQAPGGGSSAGLGTDPSYQPSFFVDDRDKKITKRKMENQKIK